MAKERLDNPVVGDNINLRFYAFNSNVPANVEDIQKVEIWFLDPNNVSETNLDGRTLVETITSITQDDTGEYHITIDTPYPTYKIGSYLDIWHVEFEPGDAEEYRIGKIENNFKLAWDLWHTTPLPVVYDFSFTMIPNRVTQGSAKYLTISINPNVARASDLAHFYENLAISTTLKISIKQKCGECMPAEDDLRLVVDEEAVDFKQQCFGYYKLDTTELNCGIYDVWFKLEYAGNTYISDKMQLQIYD